MAKKTRCPNCGMIHAIEEEPKTGTFENRVKRPTFKTGALAGSFPQQPDITEQPTGLPNWDSHVKIPLRQAVIFGLFDAPLGVGIGLVGGASLAMLFNVGSEDSLTLWGYALFIGAGGAIGGLIAISQGAKKHWPERLAAYDALLWIEEFTGFDLNGDGEIGEPGASRVEVEIQEKGIPREIDTLDISPDKLQKLAYLILIDKEGFSERTAAKAGISRDEEWKPFRDKLITRRWAKWNHPTETRQGVSLTPKGVAILGAVLRGDEGQINVLGTHPRTPTQGNGTNYERFEYIERK